MRKLLVLMLCVAMILGATPVMAEGEASYRYLYSGEVTTLNYLITATTNEFALSANVIDTLVEYDKFGQVQPSLAKSWEVSEDELIWTFHLRDDIVWVDGNGEYVADVVANDFVASAKYVLDASNASSSVDVMTDFSGIVGVAAYYEGTCEPEEGEEAAPVMEWDTVGIVALDEKTVQYTLEVPTPYFLSLLTWVCFMPVNEEYLLEKGDQFGLATGNDTILYNGAYYLSEFKPQESRILSKNAANWDADSVFIEKIEAIYNKEAATIGPELYMRGEVDYADIGSIIAAEWLADPETADLIMPLRPSGFYSYFYSFNFKPEFGAEYEPDNWLLAVNNQNFRKSMYYGIDRVKTMMVIEPNNPVSIMFNTVTPPNFVDFKGLDYTQMGPLAAFTNLGPETYNEEKALEYRDAAIAELTEAGATFPVKVLMPYNPDTTGWDEECVVLKQQLESLFGPDYVEIMPEAGPTSGFLSATRRSGMYAIQKCNWGPDFADPSTFTGPFTWGNNYGFFENGFDSDAGVDAAAYNKLVDDASAIYGSDDIEARYLAFADAEAFLIDHAIIVPIGRGSGGYVASKLNPFEGQYASFGVSIERFKGQSVLDKPMNTDDYYEAYDAWLDARAELAD